jgi:hypothetical protein
VLTRITKSVGRMASASGVNLSFNFDTSLLAAFTLQDRVSPDCNQSKL